MQHLRFDGRSLTARLVLTLIAIASGTILLIGLPTAWLVHNELNNQVQARLEQAVRVSDALYDAQRREATSLAMLTAQRPTLRDHLKRGDTAALGQYLEDLRTATGLDVILVTDPTGRAVGTATSPGPIGQAAATTLQTMNVSEQSALAAVGQNQGLMIAAGAPVVGTSLAEQLGTARVAYLLNDSFAERLKGETGLEHNLVVGGRCVATSLSSTNGRPVRPTQEGGSSTCPQALPVGQATTTFTSGNLTYYASWLPLHGADGKMVGGDEVTLPAAEINAAAERINLILLISSILFATLVAAVGFALARGITVPLLRLADASEAIGRGDLGTPLPLPTLADLSEVAILARTLEHMRSRLKAAYDELNRAKNRLENLIAALAEGVVTVDQAGRITSFSPGAERILGWRSQEVIGRPYASIFRPTWDELPLIPRPEGAIERKPVLTRDGRSIVISITGGGLMPRDGNDWEQARVFRDITVEEEAMRMRESFLASVSHEFKTPLAALRAAIELLAADRPNLSEGELQELADSILLGTLRLEELVDNLLSSASIQAGEFEIRPRPLDLQSTAEEMLLTTRPLLALRGQSLVLEIPPDLPPVQADPRRLAQVLINLISNASKYGPVNRPIRLQAELQPGRVLVRVIDEGWGIPVEKQGMLFQPFKRSDDEKGGVGLGLSIVKTIVERHHGQVGIESRGEVSGNGKPLPENGGRRTTFWFTLPLAETRDHAGARS